MPMYRKKPVVIEAFQMTRERRVDNSDWPSWLHEAWNEEIGSPGALWPRDYPNSDGTDHLVVGTLEGSLIVDFDDWIIRGIKGELYPCKPDIFAATYERVEVYGDPLYMTASEAMGNGASSGLIDTSGIEKIDA